MLEGSRPLFLGFDCPYIPRPPYFYLFVLFPLRPFAGAAHSERPFHLPPPRASLFQPCHPESIRRGCSKDLGRSSLALTVPTSPRPPYFPVCSRPNALISTSTPGGRSSFINASTVSGVGSRISISRLCVRISNCSRDFLSTCGDRSTVQRLIVVGRGIGPATSAPVRFAVSTISRVDWSRILWSYAFNRIRILSPCLIIFIPKPSLEN